MISIVYTLVFILTVYLLPGSFYDKIIAFYLYPLKNYKILEFIVEESFVIYLTTSK